MSSSKKSSDSVEALLGSGEAPPPLVCVTGANGFLGSSIVNKLQNGGFSVLALARNDFRLHSHINIQNVKKISGSLTDWTNAIREMRPQIVISCDWSGVSKATRNDSKQFENSVRISALAKSALSAGTRTFFALGSQDEVPPETHEISEQAPERPQTEYGRAKIRTRENLEEIFGRSQTNFIWGRVFTIYGPLDTRQTLITECIRKKLRNEDFLVRSPETLSSFLFIEDFTEAIMQILKTSTKSETINIGSDRPIKVSSIVKVIQELDLQSHWIDLDESIERPFLQPTWIPNIEKLRLMGWSGESNLINGISATIEWWKTKLK
jgi:nucleoside-diphosphate-sugar epimerase